VIGIQNLLVDARQEILRLRRENEILRAKVEVMELFACVLYTEPARAGREETVDIAWVLQDQIDAMTRGDG